MSALAPTSADLCAVAINMAARMAYHTQCAWKAETGDNTPHVAWEDLTNEQRRNAISFMLMLASVPQAGAEQVHHTILNRPAHNLPPEAQAAWALCPAQYRTSLAISVNVARAILDNLVKPSHMRDYLNSLENGTDAFLTEH
jgi:hypothetical protein